MIKTNCKQFWFLLLCGSFKTPPSLYISAYGATLPSVEIGKTKRNMELRILRYRFKRLFTLTSLTLFDLDKKGGLMAHLG